MIPSWVIAADVTFVGGMLLLFAYGLYVANRKDKE